MAESSAAAVQTLRVQLNLPVLKESQEQRDVVKHLQHMFNDIDKAAGEHPIFNETGEYGVKTINRVKRLQQENDINPANGLMTTDRSWKAVLEQWLRPE
jgi:hypothetical protein